MNNSKIDLGSAMPSGYSQYDEYLAQMSLQGNRVHYMLVLPLVQVPVVVPVPDPETPLVDNREIRPGHAKSFADYVRRHEDWHCGPLTVRTSSAAVEFEAIRDFGVLKLGTLRIKRSSRADFRIIDGQHRVLGIDIMLKAISEDLVKQRSLLAQAEANGSPEAVRKQFIDMIALLQRQSDRTMTDSIGMDLVIEDNQEKAKQIFVDVANNAVGISKSVTARFDDRKVMNRALKEILQDPMAPQLIIGRIDQEKDRVVGNNPNLLGAKHVAEIIKIVAIGLKGRVLESMEKTGDAQQLAKEAERYFRVLEENFDILGEIAKERVTPEAAREHSLLLSTTMLRVLADVYHQLKVASKMSDVAIGSFFKKLDPFMIAPIRKGTLGGDLWLTATTTDAVTDGATAPGARAQQVKELADVIVGWASNPPAALDG